MCEGILFALNDTIVSVAQPQELDAYKSSDCDEVVSNRNNKSLLAMSIFASALLFIHIRDLADLTKNIKGATKLLGQLG